MDDDKVDVNGRIKQAKGQFQAMGEIMTVSGNNDTKMMQLYFLNFMIEYIKSCTYDRLIVDDDGVITKLCGQLNRNIQPKYNIYNSKVSFRHILSDLTSFITPKSTLGIVNIILTISSVLPWTAEKSEELRSKSMESKSEKKMFYCKNFKILVA